MPDILEVKVFHYLEQDPTGHRVIQIFSGVQDKKTCRHNNTETWNNIPLKLNSKFWYNFFLTLMCLSFIPTKKNQGFQLRFRMEIQRLIIFCHGKVQQSGDKILMLHDILFWPPWQNTTYISSKEMCFFAIKFRLFWNICYKSILMRSGDTYFFNLYAFLDLTAF